MPGRFGHYYRGGGDDAHDGAAEAGGGGHPYRGFGGGSPWMSRRFVGWISSRLEATPEQHHLISQEMEQFFETTKSIRSEFTLSRSDIAQAMRAESFDAEVMGESFGRQDDKLRETREALVGALARIHDSLDPDQRSKLARIIERGGVGGAGRGGRWQ